MLLPTGPKHFDPMRKVEVVVYIMDRFATHCITVFCDLTGYDRNKIGTAPTPFIDESKPAYRNTAGYRAACESEGSVTTDAGR